jgi:DNA-binding transcriptional MerR regulator
MPRHAAQHRAQQDVVIPDKLYFRIGEVAKLCGVETYVLRFWETEFPQLRPNKSGTGQRLYRKREVELALRVRRLLHDEGYTIAGARQVLAQDGGKSKSPQLPLIEGTGEKSKESPGAIQNKIQRLRAEMRELLGILSGDPVQTTVRVAKEPALNKRSLSRSKVRSIERRGPTLFD